MIGSTEEMLNLCEIVDKRVTQTMDQIERISFRSLYGRAVIASQLGRIADAVEEYNAHMAETIVLGKASANHVTIEGGGFKISGTVKEVQRLMANMGMGSPQGRA